MLEEQNTNLMESLRSGISENIQLRVDLAVLLQQADSMRKSVELIQVRDPKIDTLLFIGTTTLFLIYTLYKTDKLVQLLHTFYKLFYNDKNGSKDSVGSSISSLTNDSNDNVSINSSDNISAASSSVAPISDLSTIWDGPMDHPDFLLFCRDMSMEQREILLRLHHRAQKSARRLIPREEFIKIYPDIREFL